MDEIHFLLAKSRRRYVLKYLLDNEHGNAREIASKIDGETREIHISLVHNHLPRLADHSIIEYDHRNGDFARADGFNELRPIVEQVKVESESSIPILE